MRMLRSAIAPAEDLLAEAEHGVQAECDRDGALC